MKTLLIFACLVILITPVFAQTETFTAPSGQAIETVYIKSIGGTSGTVTYHTLNGSTISGSWSYLPVYFMGYPYAHRATLTLGGDTQTFDYVTGGDIFVSTTFAGQLLDIYQPRAMMSAGQFKGIGNFAGPQTPCDGAVIGYTISADTEVDITRTMTSRSAAQAGMSPTADNDLIAVIRGYITTLWSVFTGLIFWFKFLFVDNIILVVVLYITGTMAYAMNSSRNIFVFYKTWFRQQTAFFNFVSQIFGMIVGVIAQIIQSLKPI